MCDSRLALRLLRNEPPFGPLRMSGIRVMRDKSGTDFRAAVAGLTSHRWLTELIVRCPDLNTPLLTDELELVVDAVLAAGFKTLEFNDCGLNPGAAPALVRLLSSPALKHLYIANDNYCQTLLDAPGYALLADALRGNRTLLEMSLEGIVWLDVAAEVPELFDALTGHVSLRWLEIGRIYMGAALADDDADELEHLAGAELEAANAVFGRAIGMLVAANSPKLEGLDISFEEPGTDALGPLVDALLQNTHLQELSLEQDDFSADFAEQRLLPAVRANTSLRRLWLCQGGTPDLAAEAVQLVVLREAARVAAEAAAAAGNA